MSIDVATITDSSDACSNPKAWRGAALRIAVSTAILAWLGSRTDWEHVAAAFRGLDWRWWLGGVGLYAVCQMLCCLRWFWLSRPMGFHQSLSRFTVIYFIGMFFNLFLPTSVGGDAVRVVYLAKGSRRKMAAVVSVLLDRLSGLVVLIGLACVATAVSPVPLPQQLKLVVAVTGICTIMVLAGLPFLSRWGSRADATGFGKFAEKLQQLAAVSHEAVELFRRRPGILAGTTMLSIIVQVLNAVMVWMLAMGLHLQVPAVYFGVAAPMVILFTLIPISLNGVGLREGGMVVFLGPAGVSTADAVTLAFLWFLAQTVTSACGAVVFLMDRPQAVEADLERPTFDRHSIEGRGGERRAAA